MSRIAGILGGDSREHPVLLAKMLATLQFGKRWQTSVASFPEGSLGWCGWQMPNCSGSDGVTVVLDGAIYNRLEWEKTSTDAALFAFLYQREGFERALQRVNGDFAVALYDSREKTLWLGRDRVGVKPLYYLNRAGGLAFASQPRALFALPDVSDEPNRQFVALFAASHYRYFDNDPEKSPYQEIHQLPASRLLCVKNGKVFQKTYWALQDLPDFREPEAELAERYRDLLLDAVSLRLGSPSRFAFTLSGGMDSSSIFASAAHLTRRKQDAFSVTYGEKAYDESEEIRPMLKEKVGKWHAIPVDHPDLFGMVEKMIDLHDEPVATVTWLSHYLLSQRASEENFKLLLGGLGGDELNAGEYEHFFFHFADLRQAGKEKELAREVEMWIRYHDHPVFRKSVAGMEKGLSEWTDPKAPGRCVPDRERLYRYAPALRRDYFDLERFKPVMEHPFKSFLKNRTFQDLTRETIPCCLRAEDRQTTAFDLDHRLPFFDHRLVSFMFRVPGELKFREGVTKHLLRESMRGILPEETRTRVKKTGWNAPADAWFRGPVREALLDLIGSRDFRNIGVYDPEQTRRFAEEHLRGEANHMMFLWQVVNLSVWWQKRKVWRVAQAETVHEALR